MQEESFLSSWLREDVEGKAAEMEKVKREAEEKESKKRDTMWKEEENGSS